MTFRDFSPCGDIADMGKKEEKIGLDRKGWAACRWIFPFKWLPGRSADKRKGGFFKKDRNFFEKGIDFLNIRRYNG